MAKIGLWNFTIYRAGAEPGISRTLYSRKPSNYGIKSLYDPILIPFDKTIVCAS